MSVLTIAALLHSFQTLDAAPLIALPTPIKAHCGITLTPLSDRFSSNISSNPPLRYFNNLSLHRVAMFPDGFSVDALSGLPKASHWSSVHSPVWASTALASVLLLLLFLLDATFLPNHLNFLWLLFRWHQPSVEVSKQRFSVYLICPVFHLNWYDNNTLSSARKTSDS